MKALGFGLLGMTCCLTYGQTAGIAGPSAGYVFDPSAKVVRQIRGIPGAAIMGDPIDLGMTIASAEISPGGDSAIAMGTDGSVHLFRLKDGTASERTVANLTASASSAVFSPLGSAVVLYRAGSSQIVRGLPDAPEIVSTISQPPARGAFMTAAAKSRPVNHSAIAVSDDGSLMLSTDGGSVQLLSVSSGGSKLADAQAGAAVAFAPGNHDAALVSGGTLTLFQDVGGAATRQTFPDAAATSGLAFSADGTRVLMAGPRSVTVLDRATSARQTVTCDCRPSRLTSMGSFFRLNDPGTGPLWLLDPAEGKLVFVPARPSL